MKFLFAINPVSGGVAKAGWEDGIRAYFSESVHEADLMQLTGEDDDVRLRERIEQLRPDCVVAVGGDGTVKLVAEQLLKTTTPLGILPAGSANGMARELSLPSRLEDCLDVIVNGQARPIDVIAINGNNICLHLSDIGLNARLVRYYQRNNWRGQLGYARGVIRVLLRKRLLTVQIRTEQQVLNRNAFMVVLANARMYGTGAIINPEGNVADGRFEVVVLRRISFWEFLKMFWRYRPFDSSKTEIFSATSVCIETRRKVYFQVDGEYMGRVARIDAEIQPGQLMVMLPQTADGGTVL
ncbi:putative lipid kinase yegS-like [Fibrisoma limi BUZ 3]|uniref:Putative lipid kinase yegS-like n=1 Tax=Fibrisoma limi BUZ 3 TaxID=1185876 RepID=I2GEC6_9BACT|nr:diacylglycerol kinase family protein [Fibrisoma limi]CCH52251.1 putative lipid kinase yegS-like [Fibrisoma limi BUZ 3]